MKQREEAPPLEAIRIYYRGNVQPSYSHCKSSETGDEIFKEEGKDILYEGKRNKGRLNVMFKPTSEGKSEGEHQWR